MFKTRLLSGILLVVIALITVITGGNVLFATLFLISMIGVYELYRVFEIENKAVGICGFLFAAGYYGLLYAKPLTLPGREQATESSGNSSARAASTARWVASSRK